MEFKERYVGFIKNNQFRLKTIEEDYCEFEGTLTEDSLNPYGIAHGGYIFGLADTAAGTLAVTKGSAYTLDASIDYFRPCKGTKLIAKCHLIKKGKKIACFDVEIFDEFDKMTAKAKINYCYLD